MIFAIEFFPDCLQVKVSNINIQTEKKIVDGKILSIFN